MIAWPGCATQQYAAVVFMWLPLIVARWVRLLLLIPYLFTLAGPRVAKHVKETTRATYVRAYTRPYQKTGTGKLKRNREIKKKREYVWNGPFRSSPIHLPFNTRSPPIFLSGARCTDRMGELFFDAYRIYMRHNTKRGCYN